MPSLTRARASRSTAMLPADNLPLPPADADPADGASAAAAAALVDAVRAVIQHLRGSSRGVEQQLGVHGAELLVLRKLADRPAASLAEVATRTQTDPSTASVVVRGLVERGLLERQVDPSDRRRTPIAITAAGGAVLRDAPEPAHARVARAAAPLGADELRALAERLDALAGRLSRERAADDSDGDGADAATPGRLGRAD